jgi:hypothetical protein
MTTMKQTFSVAMDGGMGPPSPDRSGSPLGLPP